MRMAVPLVTATAVAALVGCSGGTPPATRARDQAVQACQAASTSGVSSADALVHSHQAAGLDPRWSSLATAFGQVGVLRQSLGADLGAGEGDQTGASAVATISSTCAGLGVTVSATAASTAQPIP